MAIPKLEKEFEYKGFPCVILFMPLGYRCGYVGIPKDSKIDVESIDCHGGITYTDNHLHHQSREDLLWIGFDCAHYCDGFDAETSKNLFADEKCVMEQINILESTGYFAFSNEEGVIRTLGYCEEQCKDIVNQVMLRMGKMIVIKARYLKHGEPIGKEYAFVCNFLPKLGDTVKVGNAKAVVTEVDTSEGAVEKYDGKLKTVEEVED